jgi:hypothetical protein
MVMEVGALALLGVAESQLPPLSVTTFTETEPENIPGGTTTGALVLFAARNVPAMMVCASGAAVTVSATGITTGTTSVRKAVATGVIVTAPR